jgi:hypothetical protein
VSGATPPALKKAREYAVPTVALASGQAVPIVGATGAVCRTTREQTLETEPTLFVAVSVKWTVPG